MCGDHIELVVPELNMILNPGCTIKLGRFDTVMWRLCYGWYTWGGNRPVCGWYLVNVADPTTVKPLERPDLDDVYLIAR